MASLPATTTAVTQTDYPPVASHFRLSVPAIIGIVVACVGFLVLCAVTAALTVCFLERKKETKAEKENRGRRREGDVEATFEHATENAVFAETGEDQRDGGNVIESNNVDIGESLIGPRYARMIGVETAIKINTDTQYQSSAAGKGKQKENE